MKKPSLGFASQKEARFEVRKIVHCYGLGEEFFHPLLQRLFVEQPYWQDPPGPSYTKFKWRMHTLPNGATTEKWFCCYDPELDAWVDRSWNKAIEHKQPDPIRKLHELARELVMPIVSSYRDAHRLCEECLDDYKRHLDIFEVRRAEQVHHTTPMKDIIAEGLALLSPADLAVYEIAQTDGGRRFAQHILAAHDRPGLLVALCRKHHNDVHGKETRT